MISVIVPAYNYGRYISQALQSLQDQSYPDWECIIIDDGSTDNTKEIVADWIKKDNRIHYFLQKNAGPTAARNNGIEKAKGEYILFLDADDILESDKLKSHVDVFENNSEVDIAYGDVRYFPDGFINDLFYSLKQENKPWIPKFKGHGKGLVSLILKQNIMVTSSPLIKKNVFDKIGTFDPKIKMLEDWELFQRMAIHNFYFHFVDTPRSYVLMRAHQTSFSFNRNAMRSYFLPVLEKHFIKSKLSLKNRLFVLARMLEEYTDLFFLSLAGKSKSIKHYYGIYALLLPLLAFLFLPFYMLIKLWRSVRKSK